MFFCRIFSALALFGVAVTAAPAFASGYLQCVPFARAASGVDLFGNAETWWAQAAGRYQRGNAPRVGAVLSMPGTRAMPLGHVAVVTGIVSAREILIDHSNWSPINGRRGQVERSVRAVDVSPAGDWSQVRIWYAPIRDLGLRANPADGFIYSDGIPGHSPGDSSQWAKPGWQPGNGLAAIAADLTAGR